MGSDFSLNKKGKKKQKANTKGFKEVEDAQTRMNKQRWVCPRYYAVDPMLLPSGNPFKCLEEVLY